MSCKSCSVQNIQILNSKRWNPEPLYSFQKYLVPDDNGLLINLDLRPGQGIRFYSTGTFVLQFVDPSTETTVQIPVFNTSLYSVGPILELSDFKNIYMAALPAASGGNNVYVVCEVYERA